MTTIGMIGPWPSIIAVECREWCVLRRRRRRRRRLAFRIGRLGPLINLSAVDRNVPRSFDAEPDSVSTNVDYGHDDILANDDGLVRFSGQYQHFKSFLVSHQFPVCATLSVQRVSASHTSFSPNLRQFCCQTPASLTNIPGREIMKPHLRTGNEGWGGRKATNCVDRLPFGALRA